MVIASGDIEENPSTAIGKHMLINIAIFPNGIIWIAKYNNNIM